MKTFKFYFIFLFLFIFSSTYAHFGSKGPNGGSVSCSITYDTTVYIGTKEGGVYESTTSKLVNWRARPVGLKSGKITALTHSDSYLFAGTADSGVYIFNGYVGSDRYWKKINNGLVNLKISALIAIDSITILAGTDGSGIYKTVDKGVNWTPINNNQLNSAKIMNFAKAGTYLFASSGTGVFISSDNGNTWTPFNDANTVGRSTNSLSFNATSNQLMIGNSNGLFVTAIDLSSPVAAYTASSTGLPANTAIRSIYNNGSAWFLATDKGVYLSLASAINWSASNAGLPNTNVTAFTSLQNSLVAGTADDGIFKASITSPTWVANNFGFNNIRTFSMACKGDAVVVAATAKGVFVSKDLANSYKRANKGLTDSLHVNDLVFWGTSLLAATENAGVFISADTGATWAPFDTGLDTTYSIQKIVTSSSYAYLFNSDGKVFFNNGASWTACQGGLPGALKPTSFAFFGNRIALGTLGNGVYYANVGGTQWTNSNTNLTNSNVTSLVVRGKTIFCGTDGDGIFTSDTTAAFNWKKTAATSISHTTLMGLDGNHIQAMATYGGYVFASYKGGLLATSDLGTTWIAGGNQFNLPSYTNVYKIDFVSTRVFVTTENNSLYSNALSELPPNGIDEVKNDIGSFIIYPNPSNGIFNLDLKNIQGSIKQIFVYDAQGRKIQASRSIGQLNQSLELHQAAGIYYIQVITEKGNAVQKIILE
ncbi:MAG TPA: T9SS type A sorting domain-containing protein [Bacteroidia bacterium]|jgi:hypothetical protein|nr:T9SS type A sorting domain-containing protein [Bacteroidia bacterium]